MRVVNASVGCEEVGDVDNFVVAGIDGGAACGDARWVSRRGGRRGGEEVPLDDPWAPAEVVRVDRGVRREGLEVQAEHWKVGYGVI